MRILRVLDTLVVPMLACHVLLRRPWQFDRDVMHQSRFNNYIFMIEGKKYALARPSLYEVSEDYRAIKELQERISVDVAKEKAESSTIIKNEGGGLSKNKKNMRIR